MRFLVPLLLVSSISLAAQSPEPSPEPIPISGNEALAHRIGQDKPVYPRFALAAGVSGTVKAILTINSGGYPLLGGPVTGPRSLLASARDWIEVSKFRPFLRDGQPVTVTTTLPIVFALPPGAHPAHPPSALYERNVTSTIEREGRDSPPRVRWSTLSPAMRDWLARYQQAVTRGDKPAAPGLPFDQVVAAENDAAPLKQMPGNIALYPIPLNVPGHRLYLLFEFTVCVKTNCLIGPVEESPAGVHMLFDQLGVDIDLHRRHDSPYPDVLIWADSGAAGISDISGFSYYGGQWGQLYCGTHDANEEFERDEQIADRHRASDPMPPLVTLCK
jgi:hypothetical protein